MAQRRERLSHSVCHRVNAASWAVLSGPSGGIIAGSSPQSTRAVASLTKLTNALATVQWARQAEPRLGYNPLHELVTVSTHAARVTGTRAHLSSGEMYRLKDLLRAMLLASGNDAAMAIAEHVGRRLRQSPAPPSPQPAQYHSSPPYRSITSPLPSRRRRRTPTSSVASAAAASATPVAAAKSWATDVDTFVNEMNRVAAEVGSIHTRFVNPHGLDGGAAAQGHSTAADIARIASVAYCDATIGPIMRTPQSTAQCWGAGSSTSTATAGAAGRSAAVGTATAPPWMLQHDRDWDWGSACDSDSDDSDALSSATPRSPGRRKQLRQALWAAGGGDAGGFSTDDEQCAGGAGGGAGARACALATSLPSPSPSCAGVSPSAAPVSSCTSTSPKATHTATTTAQPESPGVVEGPSAQLSKHTPKLRTWRHTHKLVRRDVPGTSTSTSSSTKVAQGAWRSVSSFGGKTGYTPAAGNCLCTVIESKTQPGKHMVVVLLGCKSTTDRYHETRRIARWAVQQQ